MKWNGIKKATTKQKWTEPNQKESEANWTWNAPEWKRKPKWNKNETKQSELKRNGMFCVFYVPSNDNLAVMAQRGGQSTFDRLFSRASAACGQKKCKSQNRNKPLHENFREIFVSFSKFSQVFASFLSFRSCWDLLGPVRMRSDGFGCVWMHSEALGLVRKIFGKSVEKIVFRYFW